MIVEVKNINILEKNKSEIEKITQQALIEEKKRIKDEKYLAKQIRKEEEKRIKNKNKLNKVNKVKKSKKIAQIDTDLLRNDMPISNFENLVNKITKENMSKPYPDINSIPN